MSLVLAVTDNHDGQTALATITGSDPNSPNVLQTQPFGGGAWSNTGFRLSDGSLNLFLPTGYYWAVLTGRVSGTIVYSNIVPFAVTSSAESVEGRCLDAVQAGIKAMAQAGSLPSFPMANVYKKMALDDKNAKFPAVFLTPADAEKVLPSGTNVRDDWGRPVVVQIVDRNTQDYEKNMDQYLLWRERIMRYFINQRLAGVPEVYQCKIEPDVIFDPKLPAFAFLVSAFVIRCITRETRGV